MTELLWDDGGGYQLCKGRTGLLGGLSLGGCMQGDSDLELAIGEEAADKSAKVRMKFVKMGKFVHKAFVPYEIKGVLYVYKTGNGGDVLVEDFV